VGDAVGGFEAGVVDGEEDFDGAGFTAVEVLGKFFKDILRSRTR